MHFSQEDIEVIKLILRKYHKRELYTGEKSMGASWYRSYKVAYGGREVVRTRNERVRIDFKKWTHGQWVYALENYTIFAGHVPLRDGGDILGIITLELLSAGREFLQQKKIIREIRRAHRKARVS